MKNHTLDVVGIGNAIVDVIASADDAFLEQHGMPKGAMTLIDEERAEAIYAAMGSTVITSGGSAGNTMAGIASLGGRAGYLGLVRDDDLGHAYRHDITAVGVTFPTPAAKHGPATARCLILVTPDSQRTMNTFLGASVNLGPEEIDEALVRSAAVTYLEGYLYDQERAKQAFHDAAAIAHAAGRKVSLSLSDPFCVNRHRDAFAQLVENHVDVLFANEIEIVTLFDAEDVHHAIRRLRGMTDIAAITCGAAGSLIVTAEEIVEIPAAPVDRVVDTTGAGDLYAAGFLYGLTQGASLDECGRIASIAAAEVIAHFGARPQASLAELVAS
ncbi:MAG: adenosine kinase [Candidatus Eremiobacteraeota bacterium]|nr:adenosine kinase [Candidatus Eremiobacteraeota bacterium]